MMRGSLGGFYALALSMLVMLGVTGCVTGKDIDKLDQGMTQRLDATNKEVEALRSDVRAIRSDTQAVLKAIKDGEASIERVLTNFEEETARSRRDLDKIVVLSSELKAELKNFQGALRKTLVGVYQAQEAALRERLRVLGQVRKDLESLGVTTEPRAARIE